MSELDADDSLGSPFPLQRPRLIGVVDANAVLSGVDNDRRNGSTSWLRRMAGRSAHLFAAAHVYTEVYEKLPKMVTGAPGAPTLEQLRACLEEEYLPIIRFVHVADDAESDHDIAAITDTDDKPTGRLAKLAAPCVVFSEDRHLRRPGYAPPNWRATAGIAVDSADNDSKLQGATALTLALRPALGKWLETSTRAMYGVASVAVGLYLWDDDSRSRYQRTATAIT